MGEELGYESRPVLCRPVAHHVSGSCDALSPVPLYLQSAWYGSSSSFWWLYRQSCWLKTILQSSDIWHMWQLVECNGNALTGGHRSTRASQHRSNKWSYALRQMLKCWWGHYKMLKPKALREMPLDNHLPELPNALLLPRVWRSGTVEGICNCLCSW